MDFATASLVQAMLLQDIAEVEARRKSSEVEGQQPDDVVPFDLLKDELQRLGTTISDRRIAASVALAVFQDEAIISRMQREEAVAARDHQLARRLGNLSGTRPDGCNVQNQHVGPVDILAENLKNLNVLNQDVYFYDEVDVRSMASGSGSGSASGSASTISTKDQDAKALDTIPKQLCVICDEEKHLYDVLQAPCSHIYCRDCFSSLVEASTRDESLYPPRCCLQNIPLSLATGFLEQTLLELFKKKGVEYTTVDRTYCINAACSEFISPEYIRFGVATCPLCHERTCSMCKNMPHIDTECPEDADEQSVDALAKAEKWARCPSCKRRIELEIGCNHMTYDTARIIPFQEAAADLLLVACAKLSFAMSAVKLGRHVRVPSSTRHACTRGLSPNFRHKRTDQELRQPMSMPDAVPIAGIAIGGIV
ncbi:hypothetical protein MMC30_006375 [Trapelia coarctata]|nr:hypothetical protein [Trapelia coarctata]